MGDSKFNDIYDILISQTLYDRNKQTQLRLKLKFDSV
jgi:hypothetical protein